MGDLWRVGEEGGWLRGDVERVCVELFEVVRGVWEC